MSTNTNIVLDSHSLEPLKSQNSSWRRHPKLERTLCFTTALFLVLLVVLLLIFTIPRSFHRNDSASNLCLTPGCVKAAAEILSNVDESVQPCTDFYQFACGKWIDQHTIPEDVGIISDFDKLNDDFLDILRDLLEKPQEASEPPYVRKIKDLYSSCMNLNAIEEARVEPLKKVLSAFGGWPVVEGKNWNQNKFNWLETLVSFKKLGYSHNLLFSFFVEIDERNNTAYNIRLTGPLLSIPNREQWIDLGLGDTTTAAYYRKMVEAAKLLGAPESVAENELLDALRFEMTLANYSEKEYEYEEKYIRRDNKYTAKELQNIVPEIPWLEYFNKLLGTEIHENETLEIYPLGFLMELADLVTTTEKRVIANYMLWRIVEESLPFLSKEWRDIEFHYRKVKTGETRERPRYMECISLACQPLNDGELNVFKTNAAFSALYFRHYFDEESIDRVSEITKYIHEEFVNMLDKETWMDETTKDNAKLKAKSIRILIGYPNELLNDTLVTEYFKTLTITNESYYENMFEIKKWTTEKEFSNLKKPHVKGEWSKYSAAEIGGAMHNEENTIQIWPTTLQSPFFHKDGPYYMNFGAIGRVIGHELTHGFDDIGRHHDKDGNLKNWWTPESDEQFNLKSKCLYEQYSNYSIEGINVNGYETSVQNLADIGGLKAAYLAYLSWVEENGPEQLLPGLNYDQKQLFWISNAHILCAKYRPEALKYVILNGVCPDKFRVIGPISNLVEFSKDFNCPPNSPMNRQPKCQVW